MKRAVVCCNIWVSAEWFPRAFAGVIKKKSPKPVLPANNIPSESVKRGVVTSLLSNYLRPLCVHHVASALGMALLRLFFQQVIPGNLSVMLLPRF